MTELALHQFESEHGVELEKITKIPLEGDGTIDVRVERYVSPAFSTPQLSKKKKKTFF